MERNWVDHRLNMCLHSQLTDDDNEDERQRDVAQVK